MFFAWWWMTLPAHLSFLCCFWCKCFRSRFCVPSPLHVLWCCGGDFPSTCLFITSPQQRCFSADCFIDARQVSRRAFDFAFKLWVAISLVGVKNDTSPTPPTFTRRAQTLQLIGAASLIRRLSAERSASASSKPTCQFADSNHLNLHYY